MVADLGQPGLCQASNRRGQRHAATTARLGYKALPHQRFDFAGVSPFIR